MNLKRPGSGLGSGSGVGSGLVLGTGSTISALVGCTSSKVDPECFSQYIRWLCRTVMAKSTVEADFKAVGAVHSKARLFLASLLV